MTDMGPPPVVVVSERKRSDASSIATTSSILSSVDNVPSKRQADFERLFGERLTGDLEVIHTQSADLQAKILLHGRLYLTRTHLCFRSNIMGYLTESIHPLKDVTSVAKGTTAKWIQNAVYVSIEGPEGVEDIAYGSLGDREAMYEVLVDCWKLAAPERYAEWSNADGQEAAFEALEVDSEDTAAPGIKHTQCSGDHFKETALDIKLSLSPEQLFHLIYKNDQFINDFYQYEKKLTDIKISDWNGSDGNEKRTLSYTMHMNNPIGPSSSGCLGSETVLRADDQAYEILSETQTPGVPSGDKFKIQTRTCLTHTDIKGIPATRMLCTTQCDWSSSSWLKGTITPAVIKGQKEHHRQLVGKVRQWMKEHPEEYDVSGVSEDAQAESQPAEVQAEATTVETKTIIEHGRQIPENPVMLAVIALLCAVVLYQWAGA